jgi:hypothetical protein
MKPLDLFLLSIAIGWTCFTAHTFCSVEPSGMAPEKPFRNPAFRSIVIHHGATFERLGRPACHFIIGSGSGAADGKVETGYRWRDQIPGPHTRNPETNLESIALCLAGDGIPARKQLAALLSLLERLCRECHIPADQIRSHLEVDPKTACPERVLPMEEIRAALARRLIAP